MKHLYSFTAYFILAIFSPLLPAQESSTDYIMLASLSRIDKVPNQIVISNKYIIPNTGGHLQGIQLLNYYGVTHALVAGSSDSYSYYASISLSDDSKVVDVQKILDKPFKHAGGFQIMGNLMAVGVEDNEKRDKSYLDIYEISNPAALPSTPLLRISRSGTFERATAGCVGITTLNENWLIVAGDWNTEHLDFYLGPANDLSAVNYKKVCTITTREAERSNWSDNEWLPYQNINIFNVEGSLYLVGLASDEKDRNIADLFRMHIRSDFEFEIQKIGRKVLMNEGGNFRWGAGVTVTNGEIDSIYGCEYHLVDGCKIYLYEGR